MTDTPGLGIDFGTSNSAAGMLLDGQPHLFEVEPGAKTLPTAFFFDFDTRETLIGRTATAALIEGRDGRFMRALKRVLGTPLMHEERHILGERVTFVEIIARFLAQIKARAEAESGQMFQRALSGRPVHFHDHDPGRDGQAEADLRACYLAAGFEDVAFMLEPQAAAISCGAGAEAGARGLIVDIGGGTSDFSVFEAQGTGAVRIVANFGARIGGTDFDRALSISSVMPLFGKGSDLRKEMGPGLTPTPNAIFNDLATWEKIPFLYNGKTRKMVADMARLAVEPKALARLSEVLLSELGHDIAFAVEAGKIAGNQAGGTMEIGLQMVEPGLVAPISAASIARDLRGQIDLIAASAMETLVRAGMRPAEIDRVIYVGGSSLISLVPEAMAGLFPEAAHEVSEVFTAVADGLAIASARG